MTGNTNGSVFALGRGEMPLRLSSSLVAFALVALPIGCASFRSPPPPGPTDVVVVVSSDPDEPLSDVEVSAGGTTTKTDLDGRARLSLAGEDGTQVDLSVSCPPGFAPPSRMPSMIVRRSSGTPEYEVSCKHVDHGIIIALRTPGVPNLPVRYFGRVIGKTDAMGYALLKLEPRTGETLTLMLDTSDEKLRYLRPQNPELSVSVPDGEEVFTLEQKFVEEKPKVATKRPQKPVRIEP